MRVLTSLVALLALGAALAPVSYTHLDVYKRQALVVTTARPLASEAGPLAGRWHRETSYPPRKAT